MPQGIETPSPGEKGPTGNPNGPAHKEVSNAPKALLCLFPTQPNKVVCVPKSRWGENLKCKKPFLAKINLNNGARGAKERELIPGRKNNWKGIFQIPPSLGFFCPQKP